MPILVFFIILSAVSYLFFKTKQIRTPRPVEKQWQRSRAGMALGLGMGLFGINQLFLYPFEVTATTLFTYAIAIVFILFGFISGWMKWKEYKHYSAFVEKEAQDWKKFEEEQAKTPSK